MEDARARTLAAIRTGLGRGVLPDDARDALIRKLAAPQANVVPTRGRLDAAGRMRLFIAEAERVNATTAQLPSWEEVPDAVAACLDTGGLPLSVKVAPDRTLDGIPWAKVPRLDVARGPAVDGDRASVTSAFAGIAETGTLMLLSGPDSPTTLNFLPEQHIVLLPAERIVGTYEDAFARFRAERIDKALPRVINWITGPSRTADIEQTLLLGAHGPRRLHIMVIGA